VSGPLAHVAPELATEDHPVWSEIAPELTPRDFRQPYLMDVHALRLFSRIRRRAGVPFRVVSDARQPGIGASRSAHADRPCRAIDVRAQSSRERYEIIKAALLEGVCRIGVYAPTAGQRRQWGKNSGSVHIDASAEHPADVIWVSV
jgi:hypothetical protein